MNDSADIKAAAESLNAALEKLEQAINPVLSNYQDLKSQNAESESFAQDRARLASELDSAKAEQEKVMAHMTAREKELDILANETTQELERVIRHVQVAMEGLPS
jgi:methyl-accepting chemotaxis protein